MEVYVEPYMNTASLLIIGAGHVGRAVCELAQWTGWDVHLWDDRSEQLEELDDVINSYDGELSEVLADIPLDARSAIVMVTRNVPLDVELIPVVVKQPAAYIGLMGSARRWSTTKKLLIDAGCSENELSRISTPIGLEIGAETPEQIAISIMAEVVRATSIR